MTSYHPDDVANQYCGNCRTFPENRPAGLDCPGCGEHAALMIVGQMAMCGNGDCRILSWDPAKTPVELMADMHTVRLIFPDRDDPGADMT